MVLLAVIIAFWVPKMDPENSRAAPPNGASTKAPKNNNQPMPIEPPVLITRVEPEFPEALRTAKPTSGEVTVLITVSKEGRITATDLALTDHPAFFDALLTVLPQWRFTPARQKGEPIEVRMRITWRFTAPSPPPAPAVRPQVERRPTLSGRVFSRGIRRPLVGMAITLSPGDHEVFTDQEGRFTIAVPAGDYTARIDHAAYMPFAYPLTLEADTVTTVEWKLTPEGIDNAKIVVIGRRDVEAQRISVDRFEASHVAGTMGDPLRVIQTLPGVSTFASFVPFPIVRGAPPGDTGYFIDETPIPMLFHLGIGTSVIHPQLVDQVNFYPGVAPIRYGRYVGGAVQATTRLSERDVWVADLDMNLFQSGALLSTPLNEGRTRLTIGGRISYTGLLFSLLADNVFLNFWDYNARIDHRLSTGHTLRVAAFGAQDELGEKDDPTNRFFVDFHRLVLRYAIPEGKSRWIAGVDLGTDRLDTPASRQQSESVGEANVSGDAEDDAEAFLREYTIRPLLRWQYDVSDNVALETGADMEVLPASNSSQGFDEDNPDEASVQDFISSPETRYVFGIYHALTLNLTRWRLTPSLRLDYYQSTEKLGLDPRFAGRYAVSDTTAIKGAIGLAHAQQRFFVPIPGFGNIEFNTPLQEAWQATIGVEHQLGDGFSIDASVYGVYRRHLIKLGFDDEDDDTDAVDPDDPTVIESVDTDFDLTVPTQDGRAFGLEVLLRKKRTSKVFGWLGYTLQRVERRGSRSWLPDPLDQTHIVNGVISWRFARDWIWGVRVHYHTGRPRSDDKTQRIPGFFQIDTRLDVLWVKDDYQVNFYLDVINLSLQEEYVFEDSEPIRYMLPTVGVHGTF
ncbi:MAG: TonB-dependent receptor [Myxococcota bacterium]|nr:TonB-dependent receptor [Myxococcota bacterium]